MRYVEIVGKSLYSKYGIKHSVFINKDKVLSYEMTSFLGQGKFKIYNTEEYLIGKNIIYEVLIEDINLESYEGIEYKGIVCFEALEIISIENGIMLPNKYLKNRVKTIFKWFKVLLLYSIIIFILGILFGYYGLSVSKEQFYYISSNTCQ